MVVWVRSKRQFPIASCFEQKKKPYLTQRALKIETTSYFLSNRYPPLGEVQEGENGR